MYEKFTSRELSPDLHRRWAAGHPCACRVHYPGGIHLRCAYHVAIIEEHYRTNEHVLNVDSYMVHDLRCVV